MSTSTAVVVAASVAYLVGMYVGAIVAWIMACRTWAKFWHGARNNQ